MVNDFPLRCGQDDGDCESYNTAFSELGFEWRWDPDTYAALLSLSAQPEVRLRHYIETAQPHLLKAYDADFLIAAIQERRQRCSWALATLW